MSISIHTVLHRDVELPDVQSHAEAADAASVASGLQAAVEGANLLSPEAADSTPAPAQDDDDHERQLRRTQRDEEERLEEAAEEAEERAEEAAEAAEEHAEELAEAREEAAEDAEDEEDWGETGADEPAVGDPVEATPEKAARNPVEPLPGTAPEAADRGAGHPSEPPADAAPAGEAGPSADLEPAPGSGDVGGAGDGTDSGGDASADGDVDESTLPFAAPHASADDDTEDHDAAELPLSAGATEPAHEAAAPADGPELFAFPDDSKDASAGAAADGTAGAPAALGSEADAAAAATASDSAGDGSDGGGASPQSLDDPPPLIIERLPLTGDPASGALAAAGTEAGIADYAASADNAGDGSDGAYVYYTPEPQPAAGAAVLLDAPIVDAGAAAGIINPDNAGGSGSTYVPSEPAIGTGPEAGIVAADNAGDGSDAGGDSNIDFKFPAPETGPVPTLLLGDTAEAMLADVEAMLTLLEDGDSGEISADVPAEGNGDLGPQIGDVIVFELEL
jgi:hypothetical protein